MNNDGLSELFAQYDIGEETRADFLKNLNAARDRWWRGLLQEVNEANDLKDLQERFAHLLRYTADLEVKE
jgi:hypothetical protein